jgi:hypothetical protein
MTQAHARVRFEAGWEFGFWGGMGCDGMGRNAWDRSYPLFLLLLHSYNYYRLVQNQYRKTDSSSRNMRADRLEFCVGEAMTFVYSWVCEKSRGYQTN